MNMPVLPQLPTITGPSIDWLGQFQNNQNQALTARLGANETTIGDQLTGGSMWDSTKSWLGNGNNLGTVVQGIGALTNAWLGYQQLQQAKEGLAFQKTAFNTNLRNSTQNYNTSLEDRIRGRSADYAGKEADVQSYLAKHRLKTP